MNVCLCKVLCAKLSSFLTSGQRRTRVRVYRASLPGLRIPGCRGAGDRGGHRHRQRAVFRLGTHDHCAELPGRLPVRQVEHQG